MNSHKTFALSVFLCLLFAISSNAQQLVYHPINPSFGGYSYNASWLMASAQAQNKLTQAPGYSATTTKTDELKDFKDSFNRQILNQLSQKFYSKVFGEEGLKAGHYEIGDYLIDISNGADGIIVNISDPKNGNQTSITIPYF